MATLNKSRVRLGWAGARGCVTGARKSWAVVESNEILVTGKYSSGKMDDGVWWAANRLRIHAYTGRNLESAIWNLCVIYFNKWHAPYLRPRTTSIVWTALRLFSFLFFFWSVCISLFAPRLIYLFAYLGARILYQCVPRSVGLRRITLHKSVAFGDKIYVLLCECTSFMDHLQDAAYIAPALRARLCGYCSIYRVAEVY